jgi:beta-xylosidase
MRIKLAFIVGAMTAALGVAGLVLVTLSLAGAAPLAPSASTWTDDFDASSLDGRWSWTYEDPTHWSLFARPGFLRITTQQENRNLLLQNAPAGDLKIQTRVLFTPTENFQQAGLLVYQDDSNQMALIRAFCDRAPPACVSNGIYFDRVEGGIPVGGSFPMTTAAQGEAYLRLIRKGSVYTGSFSTDGESWTLVGTHTASFTATRIGLSARNFTGAAEIPADFDFFRLDDNSFQVLLPLVIRTLATPRAPSAAGQVQGR